ncbi:Tripartite-type tricarboxylate transporter, receptor component TctC [Franzmannia pantelleriensis]|uniref:Tripartite-type tricarboxylate transporter, receptor component TctC n=1 Tax=Franzmannia pantelleriensis TaxID=48727 RepID=A0A1G9GCE2_9GAMM|nr:tripartite tricarboxylate transporter substrate binding protein [Halomonas pantelleriensis]SDK97943.1 Tripartite-type tricarboxylate transporter, receptor component TctC [Halomonas pantelleriensis]
MKVNANSIMPAAAIAALLVAPMSSAIADNAYPDSPVSVVVHTTAGGSTDVLARLVFRQLENHTGATFVVENHPGAGGQIGYTRLAHAEPDGYTLGTITTMSIITHELTRSGVTYTYEDNFRPVAQMVLDPSVLVVREDSPYETLEELVEGSQEDGPLSWGGTFLYGAHHVHALLLGEKTGVSYDYVPFDGASESRAALLGGHIDMAAGGFSEFASLADDGEVRILASGGTERWADYPDVPTYSELGYDIVLGSNRGFGVPSGTPDDVVEWLQKNIEEVIETEAFQEEAARLGLAPSLSYMSGDEFHSYLLDLQDLMRSILPEEEMVE